MSLLHESTATRDAPPPRPIWLGHDLFPFRSRYLTLHGCCVHYVDERSGPILLFLHGNAVWSFTYRHLIAGLCDRFRCIALDFPGFGLSTAPTDYRHTVRNHATLLERFMQALDLACVTLLSHDSGGPIGLGVVVRHPEWFRAVILLDTFCFPVSEVKGLAGMLTLVSSRFPGALLVDGLNLMVKAIPRQGMKLRALSPAERAALSGPFTRRASRHVMRDLFASVLDEPEDRAELRRRLRTLDIPALLLPAGKSGAATTLLPGLEATFANDRTVIIAGAGHFSAEDAPDQILMAIRDWPVLDEPAPSRRV